MTWKASPYCPFVPSVFVHIKWEGCDYVRHGNNLKVTNVLYILYDLSTFPYYQEGTIALSVSNLRYFCCNNDADYDDNLVGAQIQINGTVIYWKQLVQLYLTDG